MTARPDVHILILAAGASRRMDGRDKLLEAVDGRPLLRLVAERALAASRRVMVALPPDRPERGTALLGLPVRVARVPDAATGMAASIRAGVKAVGATQPGPSDGIMVLPADMPDLTEADLTALIRAFADAPDAIWRGTTADGRAGHPAIFPRDLWRALRALTGDTGGLPVIAAHSGRLRLHALPGAAAVTDLDTQDDWSAWRARRSPQV
jgi:molybdenum cofactor cytidylyltransferase